MAGGQKGTVNTRQPRAAGVEISQTSLGVSIPVVYGRARIPGNCIWVGKRQRGGEPGAFQVVTLEGGIRGGTPGAAFGGAAAAGNERTYYFASLMFGLCEGPIEGVRTVYKRDTRFVLDRFDQPDDVSLVRPDNINFAVYLGQRGVSANGLISLQQPWVDGILQKVDLNGIIDLGRIAKHSYDFYPPIPSLHYPYLAYIARHAWALYQQPQLPNVTFEVFGLWCDPVAREPRRRQVEGQPGIYESVPNPTGLKVGANPADIVVDLLTDPIHGAGFVDPTTGASLVDEPGGTEAYRIASHAHGLFLGFACLERKTANEYLQLLLEQTNTTAVWSEGKLRFLPLWDSPVTGPAWIEDPNKATYTPAWLRPKPAVPSAQQIPNDVAVEYVIEVEYALTESDFLADDDEEPIRITRKNAADAFNAVTVEFRDRRDNFAPAPRESQDLASIELYGRHDADVFEAHGITHPEAADALAEARKQQSAALPATFEYRLDWRYARLDPGDLVSLTHGRYDGLADIPARIVSIKEDEDDQTLEIEAEELITGLSTVVLNKRQGAITLPQDLNAEPGKIVEPVLFEPTAELSRGAIELWIAAVGKGRDWGGCTVWMSEDGGVAYRPVGRIEGRAAIGRLEQAISSNATSLDVSYLSSSDLPVVLESWTTAEAARFTSALYLDGSETAAEIPYEVLSYTIPTLNAANRYTLSGVHRGGFGTTGHLHRRGSNVLRLDESVFKLPIPDRLIDLTANVVLKFKFTSFNVFGGGEQSLEDVPEVSYRMRGIVLRAPVAQVLNLQVQFRAVDSGSQLTLSWDPVQDLRGVVEYEIRKGTNGWARAAILGTTRDTHFDVNSDGGYWVAARITVTPSKPQYLYGTPAALAVKGTEDIVENVVVSHDELAGTWASFADQVRADAPLLWWRMGAQPLYPDAYDEATGAVHGTYTLGAGGAGMGFGGAILADAAADNRAVQFGAGTDRLDLGSHARNDLGDAWTLILWCLTGSATIQYLYSKDGGPHLRKNGAGALRWGDGSGNPNLVGSTVLHNNQWRMIAATFSRYDERGVEVRRLRLYIDGMLEASRDGEVIPVTTGQTWLGNEGNPLQNGWNGQLDEYAKIPRELPATSLKSLFLARGFNADTYRAAILAHTPDTYLRMGEYSSIEQPDASGNGQSGLIFGPPPLVTGLLGGDSDQARSFDGSGAQYVVDPTPPTPIATMGLEFVLKVTSHVDRFLCGWHVTSGLADGPYVQTTSAGTIEAHLYDTLGNDHVIGSFPFSVGETHHVFIAWDRDGGPGAGVGSGLVTIDGLAATTFVPGATFDLKTAGRAFYVGRSPNAGALAHPTAVIDEVVIHAAPLPAARVRARAEAVLTGKQIANLDVVPGTGYLRAKPKMTGYFQAPDAHIVTLARRMRVNVVAGWDVVAIGPTSIRDTPNVNALGQVTGADLARLIIAQPEISISDFATGNDWTGAGAEWIPFRPRAYLAHRIRMRFKLGSLTEGILAELRDFTWAVDVPDLVQQGTVQTAVDMAVQVTYPKAFHQPPGLVVFLNAIGTPTVPEFVRVTDETPTGFKVDVVVNTNRVSRAVRWLAQGY